MIRITAGKISVLPDRTEPIDEGKAANFTFKEDIGERRTPRCFKPIGKVTFEIVRGQYAQVNGDDIWCIVFTESLKKNVNEKLVELLGHPIEGPLATYYFDMNGLRYTQKDITVIELDIRERNGIYKATTGRVLSNGNRKCYKVNPSKFHE